MCMGVESRVSDPGFTLGVLYQVLHRKKKVIVSISNRKSLFGLILNWKLSAYKIFGRGGGVEIRGPFGFKTNRCGYKAEVWKLPLLPPSLFLPLVTWQRAWSMASSIYFSWCLLVCRPGCRKTVSISLLPSRCRQSAFRK